MTIANSNKLINNAATRNQKGNKIIIFDKIEPMSAILKIDTRSKAAKSFLAYAKTLSFVQIEEEGNSDKTFVTKIKQAEKEEGEKMTSAKTLWESL